MKHLMTDAARRDGIGSMEPGKMKQTVETIARYFPDAKEVPVDDVYTNRFLPKLLPKEKPF